MGRRERNQLTELAGLVKDLQRESELVKTVLMVREPESVTAAGAYEGLRKQVVAASGDRRAHLTRLAQMDQMLNHTSDLASLRVTSAQWLAQGDILKLDAVPDDAQVEDIFEILERSGDHLAVVSPAYIDQSTGRVLLLGQAVYEARAAGEMDGDPLPDLASTHETDEQGVEDDGEVGR